MSLADRRRDSARARLDEHDVGPDPVVEVSRWIDQAVAAAALEPTAMTLATATPDGIPSARIVLLKGLDERGFVFYTHYDSPKGAALDANPRAALVLYWPELERQVRVTGVVERVSREETAAYFVSRPFMSRIGAWASHQSAVLADRDTLERDVAAASSRFAGGDVPVPPAWGGYRVRPDEVELWQGGQSRLHDRIRYRKAESGKGWTIERLAP